MTRSDGGHTIGVAIAIPSPHRELLDEARSRFEPQAGEMPAHVTILAPIDVDATAMTAVRSHLLEVAGATSPFRLVLQGVDTFRPTSPVVFVSVVGGGAECVDLEERVRSGDMAVETRFPYHPHVTVAHDVPDRVLDQALDELSDFHAEMDVDAIGLYENVDGRWCLVEDYALQG